MQTLNIVENNPVDFNAFRLFDSNNHEDSYRKLALAEQLQTTLDLNALLNIFAMEASKYVDFSGLYFKQGGISTSVRGSKSGKKERRYELKINKAYLGTLTYAINSPISITNNKILKSLHQLLLFPINNAIQYQQAMKLAMQDGLTGLGNRRYFDEQLKRAMHHANRQHSKVGMMVCDLDKFKVINDTHGHQVGDKILINFAQALRSCVRDSDSLFRFGGDEFVLLVEDASEQSLRIIEERLNLALTTDTLLAKYNVSCALGFTFMNRADSEHSFFERADAMLYRRKVSASRSLNIV